MDSLDSLTTVAEVGAALAGFATLAGILRRDHTDRTAALGVVEMSLIAVGFSLLPALVGNLRIASGLFVVVWTAGAVYATVRHAKGAASTVLEVSPLLNAVILTVVAAAFVLGLLVALAIFPDHAIKLYKWAVHCALFLAGLFLWLTVNRIVFPDEGGPAD
jgi:hypothetical protein